MKLNERLRSVLCMSALIMLSAATVQSVYAAAGTVDLAARPSRLVVPFGAGGTSDVIARLIAAKIQETTGERVVVDNRGGAGGMIGTDIVAKAPPDGHTLVLGSNATHAIVPLLQKHPPYDPVKDFSPIGRVAITPTLLGVNNDLPVKSVKELIVLARAKPGALTYGSSGTGSLTHVAGEMLASMAGIQLTHIPYKNASAAYPDVFSGRVSMLFDTVLSMGPHIKAGRVRALAMTTPTRSKNFPDVPTMIESGLPRYSMTLWLGIFAPAGTAPMVVTRLNRELNRVLALPDVREQMVQQGAEVLPSTPEELLAAVKADLTRMGEVVRAAKIEMQ